MSAGHSLMLRPTLEAGPAMSSFWMFLAWPGAFKERTATDVELGCSTYMKLEQSVSGQHSLRTERRR